MSFEDSLIRRVDSDRSRRVEKDAPYMVEAIKRAHLTLHNPDNAIQMRDFTDLYGAENLLKDVRKVMEKQAWIKANDTPEMAENARIAEVFEAIMLEHTELSNWLGPEVSVLKTSPYDDYFNGTDLLAEWQRKGREPHVLALAVDVTFGARSVEKKLERVKRNIDSGELGKIKYFKSPDGLYRGERTGSAHVVIGVGKESVYDLASLWMKNDKNALGAHPVQRAVVEEMALQLKVIHDYALRQNHQTVAGSYARSLHIIESILPEKRSIPLGELEKDRVFVELTEQTRAIFR